MRRQREVAEVRPNAALKPKRKSIAAIARNTWSTAELWSSIPQYMETSTKGKGQMGVSMG